MTANPARARSSPARRPVDLAHDELEIGLADEADTIYDPGREPLASKLKAVHTKPASSKAAPGSTLIRARGIAQRNRAVCGDSYSTSSRIRLSSGHGLRGSIRRKMTRRRPPGTLAVSSESWVELDALVRMAAYVSAHWRTSLRLCRQRVVST